MAGELTKTTSWSYAKGNVGPVGQTVTAKSIDVSGSDGVFDFAQLSTAAVAINLGTIVGTLGEAWFFNADATNDILLYTGNPAAGGKQFAVVKPGRWADLYLGADITAPYAKASSGTLVMAYRILPP